MNMDVDWLRVHCPYCGESFDTAVDASGGDAACVEDCAVCCRPITLSITIDGEGGISCSARRDDDTG
jgi:hypothetical protein